MTICDFDKANKYFLILLEIFPENEFCKIATSQALIGMVEYDQAFKHLNNVKSIIDAMKWDNKDKICIAPTNELTKSGYYGFSNNKDIKAEWWREI